MTTFGVDFHQHLAATKRSEIPYIVEKCIDEIDENGILVKVSVLLSNMTGLIAKGS